MFALKVSSRPEHLPNCCCKNKVQKASKEQKAKRHLTFLIVLFLWKLLVLLKSYNGKYNLDGGSKFITEGLT